MKRVIRQSTKRPYVLIDLGDGWACAYSADDQLTEPHRTETFLEDRGPWLERFGPWTEKFAVSEQHVLGQAEQCLRTGPAEVRAAFRRIGEASA